MYQKKGNNKPLSQSDHQAITDLRANGHGAEHIGETISRSPNAVRAFLQMNGLIDTPNLTVKAQLEIEQLYNAGMTLKQVAQGTNRDQHVVTRHLRHRGLVE